MIMLKDIPGYERWLMFKHDAVMQPHGDGYLITVTHAASGREAARIQLDWEDWRPASAGHRLIEHGYMIIDRSEGTAGWVGPDDEGRRTAAVWPLDKSGDMR